MPKPADVFDRDTEWSALEEFATSSSPHALLGVVTGRRRQGKSYLLQELVQAHDGVYVSALELSGREALRAVEQSVGHATGSLAPRLPDWPTAVDALLALSLDRPRPVVIDEFPYLVRAVPELPSVLQAALAPRRAERLASRARLLLCGSALSFMGGLLSGSAPLRGWASLELVVQPFDPPTAAAFWGARDPGLALRLSAVVGGTPAYRRELVDDDAPTDLADFDRWLLRRVLDPRSPLFREARYLLAEEAGVRDVTGYHALLTAVVQGNRTRARIASAVGRQGTEIGHQLTVLQDAGLLARREDAFRRARPTYAVAEPLLAFYEAVMRPAWARLERGRAADVWRTAQPAFQAQVLGPHLEQCCREWTLLSADDLLAEAPTEVGSGVLTDPHGRDRHQVDVVARAGDRVLALGEVKLGERLGPRHVARLRLVRGLLGERARTARLLLFPGPAGTVDPAVREDPDVDVVEPHRLFRP